MLGVTTVLTMTTFISSTNASLPKISYVKSIDAYLAFCFFMVFASLIEYASVGYMAKRIQMRKNRFLAIQKMAEQKKNEALVNSSTANIHDASNLDLGPGVPKQTTTVHFKVHDPAHHCKGSSRENTINRYNHTHPGPGQAKVRRYDEEQPPPPPQPPQPVPMIPSVVTPKDINRMFGITASDIDKYSRIIFPVTFICFQLMYWIIYQHLSDTVVDDLVFLQKTPKS
jgi:glycine receptor alpha-3